MAGGIEHGMRKAIVVIVVAALGLAACRRSGVTSGSAAGANQPAAGGWDDFWRARSVSPAPPKSFLDYDAEPSKVLNLTHGLLGDDVVRRWILADGRRGKGDAWAANHMRLDIVN